MLVCIVCSVLSVFFTFIALISVNKSTSVNLDLYWAHGHGKSGGYVSEVYVGVFELASKTSNNDDEIYQRLMYHSSNCPVTFCRTCHKYMPVVIGFLTAFIFMALVTVYNDLARFGAGANTSTIQKNCIGASFFAVLLGLVSLIVFASTCMKKVKDYVNSTVPNTYIFNYGSAFGLLAVSICLMFINMIFNGLVSTDDAGDGPGYGQVNNNANPTADAPEITTTPPPSAQASNITEKKEIEMSEA